MLASKTLLCVLLLICQFFLSVKAKETGNDSEKALQKAVLQARQLLSGGQVEESERQLTDILRTNSSDLAARQLHAEALYQLHRYHYAADELREVLKAHPQDPDACLLMGKVLQSIHRPTQALEYYKKYLSMAPSSETTQQYSVLVLVLEDEANRKTDDHAKARAKAGNYLAAVTSVALMRWKEPPAIRVYVKDGKGVVGYRPEFEESLRQAFDDWSEATGGKIGFVFLPDPEKAQMLVTWTGDLHAPALKAEAGLAQTSYGPDGLDKADVQLLTLDPLNEQPIGTNYLYNVCLHEIGHALGLQGHSPYPEDIMASSLYTQQGLSDRDVNTVLALYAKDTATTDNLPDVDEWGRPLSPAVKCELLINTGTAAAMAGQYEKAIDKLEAALKINPNSDLARENLAVAANNFAIADGTEHDKALSLLRLALYWDPKNKAARDNLNNTLQSAGTDPGSFDARVTLAEQCLAKGDLKGGTVEYREALLLKENPGVRKKLNAIPSATGNH